MQLVSVTRDGEVGSVTSQAALEMKRTVLDMACVTPPYMNALATPGGQAKDVNCQTAQVNLTVMVAVRAVLNLILQGVWIVKLGGWERRVRNLV